LIGFYIQRKSEFTLSKVKNPKLAKQGKISYEWARSHMQILDNTINRLKKSKPLKGITLGFCLHITKETSVLLMGAKELGAMLHVVVEIRLLHRTTLQLFLLRREFIRTVGLDKVLKNMIGVYNKF